MQYNKDEVIERLEKTMTIEDVKPKIHEMVEVRLSVLQLLSMTINSYREIVKIINKRDVKKKMEMDIDFLQHIKNKYNHGEVLTDREKKFVNVSYVKGMYILEG